MPLECIYSTAGTADCTKVQDSPLINVWDAFSLHISPQEAEERLILREKPNLVKHTTYVATNGNGMFSEPE